MTLCLFLCVQSLVDHLFSDHLRSIFITYNAIFISLKYCKMAPLPPEIDASNSFLSSFLFLRDFVDDYIHVMRLISSNSSNFRPFSPLHRFARFTSKEIKTCHCQDSNHQPPSQQVSNDPRDHSALRDNSFLRFWVALLFWWLLH